MKKIGKKEIILLVVAIIVFLSALGFFCYREIPELLKPKVYYRTYTKEKGWSRWSKNGKTSGNGYDITAIQIKMKNSKGTIEYYVSNDGVTLKKNISKEKETAGNMKSPIKCFSVKSLGEFSDKYILKYRASAKSDKWDYYISESTCNYVSPIKKNFSNIKYIQIKVEERKVK